MYKYIVVGESQDSSTTVFAGNNIGTFSEEKVERIVGCAVNQGCGNDARSKKLIKFA